MSQQTAWIILGIVFSGLVIFSPIRLYLQHKKGILITFVDVAIAVVLAMIAVISWFNVFGLFG